MKETQITDGAAQAVNDDAENGNAGRIECAFCGAGQRECKTLIAGPSCYICSDCVTLAQGAVADGVLRRKWAYDSAELAKAKGTIVELTQERDAAQERSRVAVHREERNKKLAEDMATERDAALGRVELLRQILWDTDQASPEELPLLDGLDAVNIARQHYGQVLKISDKLADRFGDENEHLGQPYGNVYDAILDALQRLIDESKEGGA